MKLGVAELVADDVEVMETYELYCGWQQTDACLPSHVADSGIQDMM